MQSNDLIGGPGELFILALVVGVAGTIFYLMANLIMKAIGMDINEYAHETSRYRSMGFFEQLATFFSDARNIPVTIGVVGLFLLFGAVMMGLYAGVWLAVRMLSG